MKIVIRAGGIGSRLWPVSRKNNPKQFQAIVGDESMLKTTCERVYSSLADKGDLFVSVNEKFKESVKSEVPGIKDSNLIIETDVRNTGPAMCLEVCYLLQFCDKSEVIASLPSDDYISDNDAFVSLLKRTEEFILSNPDYILTPAVIPSYPDTGYSYMKAGENLMQIGEETIYSVGGVVEKPDKDYCEELVESGVYFCHTGMYLWQLGHIASLFEKHQPAMFEICKEIVDLMMNSKDMDRVRSLYSKLDKVSIETAITEKVDKIAMSVSNRIGWSDLGKWHVIKHVMKEGDDNFCKGNVVINEASNNLIHSANNKKIIVVNDVSNLAIVDTGDALYVSSLENSANIKDIMTKMKEGDLNKYL